MEKKEDELEKLLNLIDGEWQAYLQWGHAASPQNTGFFDLSKTGSLLLPEDKETLPGQRP